MYISEHMKRQKFTNPCIIPQFEVLIDDGLEFTIVVFGWILSLDHQQSIIYTAETIS